MRILLTYYAAERKGMKQTWISFPDPSRPLSAGKFLSDVTKYGEEDLREIPHWVGQRTVLVLLNGQMIKSLQTVIQDGDALSVLPVVSGG
jgi:molybdopterin converting factor small subunit